MFHKEHQCAISKQDDVHRLLKPLHPGSSWYRRFLRYIKTYTILNLEDKRTHQFFIHPSVMRSELKRHANGPYSYTIHPFSKLNFCMERIFFVIIIHRWLFDIIAVTQYPLLTVSCYIRDVLHFLIMSAFFITGYVNKSTKDVLISPKKIVVHYLCSYFFVDLYLGVETYHRYIQWAPLQIFVKIINKMFYVIRFYSYNYVLEHLLINFGCSKGLTFCVSNFSFLVFVMHIFIELLWWIPTRIYLYTDNYPQDSWIFQENLSFHTYNWVTYVRSLVIVASYLLGAFYDDHIIIPNEQLLLTVFSIVGRISTIIIIAKVIVMFGHTNVSKNHYENLLYQAYNYMKVMKIPKSSQTKILDRLKYSYQEEYFNEKEILGLFTEQIKTEIFLIGARHLVTKNTLFNLLPKHEIAKLFVHMKSQIYNPNELILHYKSKQKNTYFIVTGTVACFTKDNLEFTHLKDGDVFGALSSGADEIHNISYVAVEITELYYVQYRYINEAFVDTSHHHNFLGLIRKERVKLINECRRLAFGTERIITDLHRGLLLEPRKLKTPFT